MVVNHEDGRIFHRITSYVALLGVLAIGLIAGCPDAVVPPDDTDGGSGGSSSSRIVSPTTSFGISLLDPPISVLYTVPAGSTNISGYFVQVADATADSDAIADPVIVAEGLPAGESRAFSFDPQEAGIGFFRVGVNYDSQGRRLFIESQAVIQVQGSPNPSFVQPDQAVTSIEQGAEIFISFDNRDPEGNVHWRLFRLAEGDSRSASPDQIGTQLDIGTGNAGTFTMSSQGLLPGDYQLGLAATDSGFSIASTVGRGEAARIAVIPNAEVTTPIIRVVEPNVLRPPTISITAPGAADVVLFQNDPFPLRFEGRILEEGASGEIELFRDSDRNATNGFVSIEDDINVSVRMFPFPTNAPEGTHNIGATIRDQINAPVTTYATGRIIVVRTVTLDVTQPTSPLPVPPGTPVNISWTSNAPPTAGTVDVFARTVDNSGQPFGAELPILTGAAVTTTSAQFASSDPGRFQITVRINVRDGTQVIDNAPALVRFSSLPGVVWLGSLADPDSEVEGAIFGGVNFEDNAGTSLTTAGDLDQDGNEDFVIAARYGKPFFVNPTGVGPGEAYIIYGESGAAKLRGEYNLNSVGTTLLRGVTLTGIRTENDSNETDGLSDVGHIPDADFDGIGELIFGFPKTNSRADRLAAAGQFLNGGVVVVSSDNSVLTDPESRAPVIDLDQVGQNCSTELIDSGATPVLADLLEFFEGDPDAVPQVPAGCVSGQDGVLDSVIGPGFGFTDELATPVWATIPGFTVVPPDTTPAPETCPTQFIAPSCSADGQTVLSGANAGSGFFLVGATPLEPRGARLLGQDDNDRFGTSVTYSFSAATDEVAELIISAPRRSATADEVDGLGDDISDSGIGYMAPNLNFWDPFSLLPKPFQYIVGETSFCGAGREPVDSEQPIRVDSPVRLAGDVADNIENILGMDDFNGDGRNDVAIGAPEADGGKGRVYIAFRREERVESDYVLDKLGRHPEDQERLTGALFSTGLNKGFGFSLASGVDFNGDGISDLVVGAPDAEQGVGEVVVIFGQTGLVTPEGGYGVEELLQDIRTVSGGPVAVRIKGNPLDQGLFGFNVANAGDIDNDGKDDLLIAAPHASPRFDPNPNDSVDELTQLGVDFDLDGVADDVPGDDRLLQAGLVYVVYGSNRLDRIKSCSATGRVCTVDEECQDQETCTTNDFSVNINQLGTNQLRGFIIVGRRGVDDQSPTGHVGDRLGGGDAGNTAHGGIAIKSSRGRSHGLASAGDVDGDGRDDILIGSILADPRRDPTTQVGVRNGGEAYLLYGSAAP